MQRFLHILQTSKNMQPILNINIWAIFSVKYNCNISKFKLVFPLSNESFSTLIALFVKKIINQTGVLFFETPGRMPVIYNYEMVDEDIFMYSSKILIYTVNYSVQYIVISDLLAVLKGIHIF